MLTMTELHNDCNHARWLCKCLHEGSPGSDPAGLVSSAVFNPLNMHASHYQPGAIVARPIHRPVSFNQPRRVTTHQSTRPLSLMYKIAQTTFTIAQPPFPYPQVPLTASLLRRSAFRGLKLPEAVRNEFVSALVEARAPVPVTQDGWKRLEGAIGEAVSRALEPMALRGDKPDILDEPLSVLVRDPSQRAYDMTVLVDTTRAPPPFPPPRPAHSIHAPLRTSLLWLQKRLFPYGPAPMALSLYRARFAFHCSQPVLASASA